ncbi:MAG: hypothetical protein K9G76_08630 [Bacteroidales bacterium]|nr:hypothetical protein [Bacteroidales bacterium]MCF8404431.1 hypothetical protein [Bacteroidales bacterium]
MKKFQSLFFLSFLLFSFSSLSQSPWLPGQNNYYTHLSFTYIPEYNELFNTGGDLIPTARSATDYTLQFYSEYGISNSLALSVSIPYKMLSTGKLNPNFDKPDRDIPNAANVYSLGNTQLGIKYKIAAEKWVSAAQLKFDLPAQSSKAEESGLYSGYNAWAISPVISLGRGWNKTYFYSWASYILRTNNISDHLDLGIEGGFKPSAPMWLITYVSLYKSFTDGNAQPPPAEKQYGLYSNHQEYSSFGLKAIYEIQLKNDKKMGFIALLSGAFSGYLVAHAPLLSIGVYLKK